MALYGCWLNEQGGHHVRNLTSVTTLEIQNPSIYDISKLDNIWRSKDFEALNLRKGRSGIYIWYQVEKTTDSEYFSVHFEWMDGLHVVENEPKDIGRNIFLFELGMDR